MPIHRRMFLQQGAALASVAMLTPNVWALAEPTPGLEGLDLYVVYRKMFSSTLDNAECCWWYLGTQKVEVPDIGPVATSQVETCMVYKTRDLGSEGVEVAWKEIGVFRDLATGEVPGPWLNPQTGQMDARRKAFEDGPAAYSVHRAPGGVKIALQQAHAEVQSVRATFTVANGQVCITQTEDKIREVDTPHPLPLQTVLKIYASLVDLKAEGRTSVMASGFYTARTTAPGAPPLGVTGLMQKAAVDEKLNPIAWDRMRSAYPAFFKDQRVDPSWK